MRRAEETAEAARPRAREKDQEQEQQGEAAAETAEAAMAAEEAARSFDGEHRPQSREHFAADNNTPPRRRAGS